ncbi:MAG: hypothetical protein K2Q03_00490 [Sphingobacteriaceae bacterium]|nr:hypothetical protein [Sphingobacteriaceae bacterium]
MKNISLIRKAMFVLSIVFFTNQANAQDAIGNLFKSGPDDAGKLINAYLNPLFTSLGTGLNSGWSSTAKTKGTLKFDIKAGASFVFVPKENQSYNLKDLGLTGIVGEGSGQTIFGNNSPGDIIQLQDKNNLKNPISAGKLPSGLGVNFMPIPQIQLTVGLPKNIDLSLRFVPTLKLGDDGGQIGMFGIGTKIEPLPLILGSKMKALPFDLAIAANYSRFKYNIKPKFDGANNGNQEVSLNVNGYNIDAIFSKKIAFFTPFVAFGYNNANASVVATGNYAFTTVAGSTTFDGSSINFSNTPTKNAQATLGFELHFFFVKFYASYTAAKYNFFNSGIGIGIGN